MKDILGQEIEVGAKVLRGGMKARNTVSAGFLGYCCHRVVKINANTVTITDDRESFCTVMDAKPETVVVVDKILEELGTVEENVREFLKEGLEEGVRKVLNVDYDSTFDLGSEDFENKVLDIVRDIERNYGGNFHMWKGRVYYIGSLKL